MTVAVMKSAGSRCMKHVKIHWQVVITGIEILGTSGLVKYEKWLDTLVLSEITWQHLGWNMATSDVAARGNDTQ